MKKFLCVVLSFLMIPFTSVFALDFTDVNETEDPEISFLADTGVVNGRAEGIFAPDELVNRAEMLKILFDLVSSGVEKLQEELPTVEKYHDCFTDVSNEWFAPYVCYAKESGTIDGYPDGSFRPGNGVNLVEALKMAFETFQFKFTDGSEWYSEYYDAGVSYDVYSNKNYEFGDFITRRTMAQIAARTGLAYMTQGKFDPELFALIKSSGKSLSEIIIAFQLVLAFSQLPSDLGAEVDTNAIPTRTELLESLVNEISSHSVYDSTRKAEVYNIIQALETYNIDHNSYPEDIYDGSLDTYFPSGEVPVDPVTGEHYSYVVGDDLGSYEVSATLDNGEESCSFMNLTGSLVDPCDE